MAKFEINDEVVYTFIDYRSSLYNIKTTVYIGIVKDILNFGTYTSYIVYIYSLNSDLLLLETTLEPHIKVCKEDLL